jgi:hypothetical protein
MSRSRPEPLPVEHEEDIAEITEAQHSPRSADNRADAITVAVRMRPKFEEERRKEIKDGEQPINWEFFDGKSLGFDNQMSTAKQLYTFDRVLDWNCDNAKVGRP